MTATPPAPQGAVPSAVTGQRLPVRRGLFEPVVAQLTYRTILGRRRALLLGIVPALLLVLAAAFRRWGEVGPSETISLLDGFSISIVVPLIALIAATSAIGPEVDDGSIVYLLAKPLSRYTIASSKFAVAAAVSVVFGAGATLVAGTILGTSGDIVRAATAMTVAALLAGLAYVAVFLALAVFTRAAVVIGLIYIIVWEGLLGGLISGAQQLSVHQWALAVAERMLGADAEPWGLDSHVSFSGGVILLAVVTVGGVYLAGRRLRTARLTSDE